MQNSKAVAPHLQRAATQIACVEVGCDEALRAAMLAVELARRAARELVKVDLKSLDQVGPNLTTLATAYLKVEKLGMPDNLDEADPKSIRKAIEWLQILP
jgi:hypothetical protein